MRRFRDLPVRSKLTLLMTGLTFIALAAGFAAVAALDYGYSRRELVKDARLRAKMAAEYSVAALAFGYRDEAGEHLRKLSVYSDVVSVAVYGLDGNLFASYPADGEKMPPQSLGELHLSGAHFAGGQMEVHEPAVYQARKYGMVCLNVSMAPYVARIAGRLKVAAAIALCVSVLVFLAASRVQRLISGPILRLAGLARAVSEKEDYFLRTGIEPRGDEIGVLAEGFDRMLGALEARGRERDAALDALRRAQAGLEAKVAERTSELSFANRELEAFTYSASHDLRAPLRRIDGYSALMEQECGATPRGNAERNYLVRIRAGCRQMTDIIDSLLSLSKIMKHNMEMKEVDLGAIAEDVAARMHENEPGRAVAFSAAHGALVAGDPVLLTEVMENLLGNAWKFTSKARAASVEFGFLERADGRIYFVRDNGCGFEMEYVGKLFKPFQRLHSPSEFPGTGIGLSTVQRIVERHGGEIWAESGKDKGAVFYFTLPAAVKAAAERHAKAGGT